MTGPDYPLLTVPGYELYQLAHLATFVVDALARHRAAAQRGDRAARRAAARDVHAGRRALARTAGTPDGAGGPLPRPLDTATYRAAQQLLAGQPEQRHAQIVSLAALGRHSWAVLGHIPPLGPVGAEVPNQHLATALREHLLTRPADELHGFAITARPAGLGLDQWRTADETATVAALDPDREQHAYLALALQGISADLDTTIDQRFRTRPASQTAAHPGPTQPGPTPPTAQPPTPAPATTPPAPAAASPGRARTAPPNRNGFPAVAAALPTPTPAKHASDTAARPAAANGLRPPTRPRPAPTQQPGL